MAIEFLPLPLPASADPASFVDFGRQVKGIHPGELTPETFPEIRDALYKHGALLFRDVVLTPEQQYALTKVRLFNSTNVHTAYIDHLSLQAFDPVSSAYGHGNNKTGGEKKSILHPDLKTIPRQPQVQVIGNGTVYDHEGLAEAKLKHPSHRGFHKTVIPIEEDLTFTRFYRWY